MTKINKEEFLQEFDDEFLDALEAEEDQSKETSGGERELPAAGVAFLRFVAYQELGDHQGMYQGKPKAKLDREVRLVFEIVSKRHTEGKDYPQTISLQTMTISSHEKSKYLKLFKIMTQEDDTIKHLARCLGKAYKAKIFHETYTSKKTGKEITFATIVDPTTKLWTLAPMIKEDEETGEIIKLKAPEAKSPLCCFIWNKPMLTAWNLMFIDGTNDEGKSKNWIQERCLEAKNFKGSPLQTMLMANNLPTEAQAPDVVGEVAEDEDDAPEVAKTASKASKKAEPVEVEEEDAPEPTKKVKKAEPKQVEVDEDEELTAMARDAGLLDEE